MENLEQIFNLINDNSKSIIDMIADPEVKVKANKYLKQLYEDYRKNNTEAKLQVFHPEKILELYKNFLISEGKANSSIYNYILRAKHFHTYLRDNALELCNLNLEIIECYLAGLKQKNPMANSYAKELIVLKSYLKFLYSRNFIALDGSKIKPPKKVETIMEVLSEEDIKRVEKYFSCRKEKFNSENIRDILIINFGTKCSLRRSEIIGLDWEHINLKTNRMKIVKSKGGKTRVVYFSDDIKNLLIEYRRITRFYKGAVIRGKCRKRITKSSLQNLIRRIYIESGIYREGLCIHSLRHTFAEIQRKNGTDICTLSKMMGHTSISTTEKYMHSNDEDLQKAIII